MSVQLTSHLTPSPPQPISAQSTQEQFEQTLHNLATEILALPEENSPGNTLFTFCATNRERTILQHTFKLLASHSSPPEITSILQHFLGKFPREIFHPLTKIFECVATEYARRSPTVEGNDCFFDSNCFIAQHFPFQIISAGGERRVLELLNFFRGHPPSDVSSSVTLLRILTEQREEESVAVAAGLLLDFHHPSIVSPRWAAGLPIVRTSFLRITQISPSTAKFLQDPPLNLPKDLVREIAQFTFTKEDVLRGAVNFCFSEEALDRSIKMGRWSTPAHPLSEGSSPANLLFGVPEPVGP